MSLSPAVRVEAVAVGGRATGCDAPREAVEAIPLNSLEASALTPAF